MLPVRGCAGGGEVGQGTRAAEPVAQPGADRPACFGWAVFTDVAVAFGGVHERFFGCLIGPCGSGLPGAGGDAGRAEQGACFQPGRIGGGVPAAGLAAGQVIRDARHRVVHVPGGAVGAVRRDRHRP